MERRQRDYLLYVYIVFITEDFVRNYIMERRSHKKNVWLAFGNVLGQMGIPRIMTPNTAHGSPHSATTIL